MYIDCEEFSCLTELAHIRTYINTFADFSLPIFIKHFAISEIQHCGI